MSYIIIHTLNFNKREEHENKNISKLFTQVIKCDKFIVTFVSKSHTMEFKVFHNK